MDEYKDLPVKHFKLSSGDEILGLIAGVDNQKGIIHIEYPVLIDMIGSDYMLMDYMPTSVKNIVLFSAQHVIAQSDVHDSVKHEYIKYCLGATSEPEPVDDDPFELANKPLDKSKYH
jgi:hypothetical protein